MASALVGYQPISIAFEVVDDFMHYKDGVYTSTKCKNGPSDVNHAVLAVGYGAEEHGKKLKFWDVKNSWGDSWGHKVLEFICIQIFISLVPRATSALNAVRICVALPNALHLRLLHLNHKKCLKLKYDVFLSNIVCVNCTYFRRYKMLTTTSRRSYLSKS